MRSARLLGLGFLMLSAACAASGRTQGLDPGSPGDGTGAQENTIPEDPETAPPHALGTIVLGESRSSTTGDSNPLIAASFVPDAKLSKSCTKKVGACEVTETPQCMTGSMQGCGAYEVCTFDDDCTAKCVQACTKACGSSEVCYFTSKSSGTATEDDMACKKKDRFDAGALAFDGTTQAITLFPPYAVTPSGNGAPFMARSEIRVQASGGSAAGFEKFDEKFTSTTFLETDPPLRELPRSKVFGSGAVAISWIAGEDTIYVGATGPGGVAKCQADDASGAFELPRSVIREVMSAGEESTSSTTVSISVTRERREVRKGKKTFGELSSGQIVQPEGWVELVTRSTETHSFASCSSEQALCDDQCVNVQSDQQNCGGCGTVCPSGYYCSAGACRY